MTGWAIYQTALALAEHDLTSDAATTADIDAAADYAGVDRPDGPDDRHLVRETLDQIA